MTDSSVKAPRRPKFFLAAFILTVVWFGVGGVLGPGISGAMLGADLNKQWIFLIILGCFLGILGARTMRPLLSVEQDGRLFSKSN
mgnify:CR=1 FL=1